MNTNRKFDLYSSLVVVLLVAIFFSFVLYFVEVGSCMARARQIFGIQYEDSFIICFEQIGSFR